MEFTQDYSSQLAMHPQDSNVMFSSLARANPSRWVGRPEKADSVIIRTGDGGKSWERVEGGIEETSDRFAEMIVFDEADPDNMYLGFRTGEIYGSHDGGESWAQLDVTVPPDLTTMRCVRAG